MKKPQISAVLARLRDQATSPNSPNFASHQLDAHLSLAYACEQSPEPWELYRVPSIHGMPSTAFYTNNPLDIQEAIYPKSTFQLLQSYAVEKIAFEASMTTDDFKLHSFPGNVKFVDSTISQWVSVEVPRIRWFDERSLLRKKIVETTREEFVDRVMKRLTKLRQDAKEAPNEKLISDLKAYEYYVAGRYKEVLRDFEARQSENRAWLQRLETTRDFGKTVFSIVREAENEVRRARGIAAIGESWISETDLLYRVRELLPDLEVIAHGNPSWLGRQHLDIWIPSRQIAIEYQGAQHFQSVEFFGGEEALQRTMERDERKRSLCDKNGVRLIEIRYDQEVSDATLLDYIAGSVEPF